ncbi:uncharacterized protein EI97DRAFT_382511 [Westerdykella ornata]|uniref:Uncharacterized protein n=1 Tax=Westerdykella ornata TaxID=318751 RepID=A0A6A6JE14_WESOR|nr:uncharacterized protein EI97DRAFT_382511 [Westerdykella ornata]KAF2273896.1 hypothetical protein EI97DRAFT_382511 [Westerdykella ornata]
MAVCVSCQQPLVIELEHDEHEDFEMGGSSSGKAPAAEPETIPDDVLLNCGCHFHWTCLLEAYQITECPNCGRNIATTSQSLGPQVLCTLHNEGGLEENVDILPLLTEESYLKAYPEDRKRRAFLEFCREGDLDAIVYMLKGEDEEDGEEEEAETHGGKVNVDELLRYQDPIGDMQSALHAAVQGGSQEVAWLLLLLASNLDMTQFPAEVFQEAQKLGIMRGDLTGKADIRSLKDSDGRTAEDLAREIGGVWTSWLGTGRLSLEE